MKELAKCPNCGKQNKINAKFCENCGTTLSDTNESELKTEAKSTSGGIMGFWDKQSTKGKAAIGIAGICCIGLIFIIVIGGMIAPDQNTNTSTQSATTTSNTPTTVTITQLYGSSIAKGTYVKVTGTVLDSSGTTLRIENPDGQDIMVEGNSLSAYEGHSVTVVGTFYGPSAYNTVMGSSRTVPTITDAKIIK